MEKAATTVDEGALKRKEREEPAPALAGGPTDDQERERLKRQRAAYADEDDEGDGAAADDSGGEETAPQAQAQAAAEDVDTSASGEKRVKRRVALLVAYLGTGYQGLQKNPTAKTLEADFERALHLAGMISASNYGSLAKVGWQRTARTDKGVHAAGQVLSAKLLMPAGDWSSDKVAEQVNAHLPPALRVLQVQRVTASFNAKNHCTARTYHYLLPVAGLAPSPRHPQPAAAAARSPGQLAEALQACLAPLQGTHNFHNFTAGVRALDPRAMRYMRHIRCELLTVSGGGAVVRVELLGQSFMLHQIRKMVAMGVALVRDGAEARAPDIMRACVSRADLMLPLAPGPLLMLRHCHFDGYNKKVARDKSQPPLEWEKHPAPAAWTTEQVLPHVLALEAERGMLRDWLAALDSFPPNYDAIIAAAAAAPPLPKQSPRAPPAQQLKAPARPSAPAPASAQPSPAPLPASAPPPVPTPAPAPPAASSSGGTGAL